MEFKGISNLEKMSNDPKDFNVWCLRLKNNLTLVNPLYVSLLEVIVRLPGSVVTYEQWAGKFGEALKTHSSLDDAAFNRLKTDLYTVMVEKCSDSQVLQAGSGCSLKLALWHFCLFWAVCRRPVPDPAELPALVARPAPPGPSAPSPSSPHLATLPQPPGTTSQAANRPHPHPCALCLPLSCARAAPWGLR